jgi:hypothetical protein
MAAQQQSFCGFQAALAALLVASSLPFQLQDRRLVGPQNLDRSIRLTFFAD